MSASSYNMDSMHDTVPEYMRPLKIEKVKFIHYKQTHEYIEIPLHTNANWVL